MYHGVFEFSVTYLMRVALVLKTNLYLQQNVLFVYCLLYNIIKYIMI